MGGEEEANIPVFNMLVKEPAWEENTAISISKII